MSALNHPFGVVEVLLSTDASSQTAVKLRMNTDELAAMCVVKNQGSADGVNRYVQYAGLMMPRQCGYALNCHLQKSDEADDKVTNGSTSLRR
jgi:hypothetical protein